MGHTNFGLGVGQIGPSGPNGLGQERRSPRVHQNGLHNNACGAGLTGREGKALWAAQNVERGGEQRQWADNAQEGRRAQFGASQIQNLAGADRGIAGAPAAMEEDDGDHGRLRPWATHGGPGPGQFGGSTQIRKLKMPIFRRGGRLRMVVSGQKVLRSERSNGKRKIDGRRPMLEGKVWPGANGGSSCNQRNRGSNSMIVL